MKATNRKLDDEIADHCRDEYYNLGTHVSELAKQYGVSKTTMTALIRNSTYKTVRGAVYVLEARKRYLTRWINLHKEHIAALQQGQLFLSEYPASTLEALDTVLRSRTLEEAKGRAKYHMLLILSRTKLTLPYELIERSSASVVSKSKGMNKGLVEKKDGD